MVSRWNICKGDPSTFTKICSELVFGVTGKPGRYVSSLKGLPFIMQSSEEVESIFEIQKDGPMMAMTTQQDVASSHLTVQFRTYVDDIWHLDKIR